MPSIYDVIGKKKSIYDVIGEQPPIIPFDPVSQAPPIQEAEFVPDPTSRPIAETQEAALGAIDRLFGIPKSLEDVSPIEIPGQLARTAARGVVGAVGFLPTLAEGLIRPPEGQTTLDVASEVMSEFGGMLGRFLPQMRLLATKGFGLDPDKPLNPADRVFISLVERISGKPIAEFNRELEAGLLEAPEEPFFSALIGAGGVRGGIKLTKRLQKVKEPPPTIIEEPTVRVTLPEARPEIEKLPIQEVPKPTVEKITPVPVEPTPERGTPVLTNARISESLKLLKADQLKPEARLSISKVRKMPLLISMTKTHSR